MAEATFGGDRIQIASGRQLQYQITAERTGTNANWRAEVRLPNGNWVHAGHGVVTDVEQGTYIPKVNLAFEAVFEALDIADMQASNEA